MISVEHELIQMRRRDYMRQAEHYRLFRIATACRATLADKLMAWTGRRLVSLGQGLQSRATAAPAVVVSDICC